jgi:hypothetical protein
MRRSILGIYLGSNTSEGKAYNVAFTLAKNFRSDFIDANISGTYSYGKSTVLLLHLKTVHNGKYRDS